MTRIDTAVAAKFKGGRLISLRALTQQLGQHPTTVYAWARRGVEGQRLPTIRLGGWRYTTIQAFNQFVENVDGWSGPRKRGASLDLRLGRLTEHQQEVDC